MNRRWARNMSHTQLTAHIAAVIADPECPPGIYNALTGAVLDLTERHHVNVFDPAIMRMSLPLALEREAATVVAEEAHRLLISSSPDVRAAEVSDNLIADRETPEALRSVLIEFCTELSNWVQQGDECVCSTELIRQHLPSILERSSRRRLYCPTGGVRFDQHQVVLREVE